MIIDGKDLLAGRVASYAAKNALLGEEIHIVNCEQLVISGSTEFIIEKYKHKYGRGTPAKGPFIIRHPEKFVKRIVRGMLPYKQERGRNALKRIKCHLAVPEQFKSQKIITLQQFNHSKLPNLKFMSVKELCHELGGK